MDDFLQSGDMWNEIIEKLFAELLFSEDAKYFKEVGTCEQKVIFYPFIENFMPFGAGFMVSIMSQQQNKWTFLFKVNRAQIYTNLWKKPIPPWSMFMAEPIAKAENDKQDARWTKE